MPVLRKLDIREFECGDWVLAVLLALRACSNKNAEIFFPAGTYNFFPERAVGKYSEIPNHDYDGYRKYAIYLENCENIKITGEQANFICHGDILPVYVKNSKNICLEGFSVDFSYPCYALVTISNAGKNYFEVTLNRSENCRIKGHWLFFDRGPLWGMTEYECFDRKVPFAKIINLGEDCSLQDVITAKLTGRNKIAFSGRMKQVPRIGNKMILRYGKRDFPAVFFSSCSNISLNNFTVFQARGMGVIAEACRNINVDGVKIVPFDSRRYLSTCADALHLVNCSGEILINNCVFKNQMDDSINIHGIYSLIERVVGSCSVLARLEHGQHQGSIIAFPNNKIRIVKRDSLQAVGELTVESVYKINSKYYLISFNSSIPENIKTGMAMENISLRPDKVKITNCISKNNNPRGILISTGQEVIIENNYISSPEAAIRISGDANSWYESGPVEMVIIRNNRFEHCGYSARNPNNAIIDIDPEIKRLDHNFFYHGDIIVKDNIFTDFTCRLIHGNSFEGLNFTNNIVVQNVHSCENDLFELNHYKDVQIDNNQINKSCNNVPMRETVSV